jgi:hypothetical protein
MGILDFLSPKSPEEKLMTFLKNRIESAGMQNNPMKNDPLLSPMGFISAMSDEKDRLKSRSSQLARDYNVTDSTVRISIDNAYNQIYNKHIE